MRVDELNQFENVMLLNELCHLKMKMKELYHQKGPCCPDYISHSLKFNSLVNQYLDEKIMNLHTVSGD
jgi:hypothetical protein